MKINVTRSSMPYLEEYINEISELWDSRWLTNNGVKHQQFKSALCDYLGVSNTELFCNGHQGLEIALDAMNLSREVITTPFTFASTTHAIVRQGLIPVFCDVKDDCTIDPDKIESLITDKTSAIVAVHVYGNICDVQSIETIAKKHNLKVVYDAAHAFGVTVNGRGIGSFGDASMFSFHATKVFHTIEGGAVTFSDEKFGERMKVLRNFGIEGEDVTEIGTNAKMNEFQAAMGLCNLRQIDEEFEEREMVWSRYVEHLSDIPGIQIKEIKAGFTINYAYFPVRFTDYKYSRDEVIERLKIEGVGARKYFYPLTSAFSCYRDRFDPGHTPIAEAAANEILTLPLYADLSLDDVDRICKIILE
ncbi:DegT/DnrJ/EryC1/StrS family aminotransferase [Salisediminibacterium beveridgei]|uniref:UDP-4-amino-4-deoxy-L-arabinose--oxoglutarate aminotransferase n=1 Tax=Salisediminibacterium beveridgei TaxID=632773 RepID=A0A1D7QRM8_9BACI|nr:DegT/DnrJ/EryC1/StrS family aminotransferase [Salisediminibacterium beveridgei]AOM81664.1 UDP-4-amino-4-deoxy-L-arabinose--oxoglutarate aminotransferase [Salisediminibacterium beveridgei]